MSELHRLQGLPPVVDVRTRVLVLGSFPGAASLAARRYYHHPRNQFWPIIHAICAYIDCPENSVCSSFLMGLGPSSPPLPEAYAERCEWLLAHGVGLWDVYASCERQGSLDAHIRHAQVNDLASLHQRCPHLQLVAHNGGESHRHHRHTERLGVPVVRLPSTSPAHASWSLDRKMAAWSAAIAPVLREGSGPARGD